ncbi:MAG: tRNA (adenosine(37)-N6)-dimethylallyltransferase MiaA [Chryseolinea sp.]
MRDKKLIVVIGPTAVGKTAVSIQLAQHFRTEIISADSRQIFKELTIGTAKPSEAELASIKHHFIDSHSINENYDAAQYGREALELIHQLFKKYDYLILCGGSGLYVKALLEGFDDIPEVEDEIREELNRHYEREGIAWLRVKMKELDSEHYETIDQQNPHRLMRALEVKIGTGLSISSFRKKAKLQHPFSIVKIGLELPREVLNKRIDDRMDQMILDGLFEEVKQVFPFKNQQALQTVGYQEIFDFMEGKYDREEAIRLLKRNSRRYAKRQMTWFKRDNEIVWMNPVNIEEIYQTVQSFKFKV